VVSPQNHKFHSDLRLLPLGSFDLIIGMDWLVDFSPMKVHWAEKWLSIPYGSGHILFQGLSSEPANCLVIQLYQADVASNDSSTQSMLPEVQLLLDEFSSLFAETTELLPRRPCDHRIPLVPGVAPVAVRQYRYKPALKDEIECQVFELLRSGFIRPNQSVFSSPVLLVCKKDGSWRMCVDYRMLNALTVKSKFPIPIVDELLDELSGAKWFSYLDLRAGFNQIHLAPGEEYKTTLQTHWG
jgi:hypothetical protein